jgi:hypothetical protein
MRSTSKKVKISVVSSSGGVQSQKHSLTQIRLARLAHEKERAREKAQEGKLNIDIRSFHLISTTADLNRHSRQLLADAYLESGFADTSEPDPGLIFQPLHALDEDIGPDDDNDDLTDEDIDERTEEIIYRYVFQVSLLQH